MNYWKYTWEGMGKGVYFICLLFIVAGFIVAFNHEHDWESAKGAWIGGGTVFVIFLIINWVKYKKES